MQQAWITYRDTTCNFYMDKFRARWRSRWERLARRAKPPAGRSFFGFLDQI